MTRREKDVALLINAGLSASEAEQIALEAELGRAIEQPKTRRELTAWQHENAMIVLRA